MSEPIGPSDPTLQPGTMVGAYSIERRLGAGGVGTVYAALEPTIRKKVAIKVLKHSFAEDAAAVERFKREAQSANEIRHPGIVDVFAIGVLPDGRPYLVMSLLEGHSLREEIASRGRLPPDEAWRIAREIADALAAAHEAGIVHRDLKPDNVFLEEFGNRPSSPRILDFGLAKVPADEGAPDVAKLTQTGVMMGTPAYMAPEQWWSSGVDARTDQYAFGVLLFEMLAGSPPFHSQQYVELLQKHLHEAPPRLAERGARVGTRVEALVARCLAKKSEERFESMRAVIAEGDAAFGASGADVPVTAQSATAISHAETIESDAGRLAGAVPAPATEPRAGLGGFVLRHAAILAAGMGGLVAMGYAGQARREPAEWLHGSGLHGYLGVLLLVVGWIALVFVARARARGRGGGQAGWWIAVVPALAGAAGTWVGWIMVTEASEAWPSTERFATFNVGMYEANTSRFLGFAFSMVLFLAVAALPARSGEAMPPEGAFSVGRRVRLGALGVLVLLAAIAVVSGAPSAAFVSCVAAAGLLVAGTGAPGRPLGDEVGRVFAVLVATVLALAVGLARVEAREAVLWDESPARATRATEVAAAAAERTATSLIAIAAVVVVALVVVLLLVRARRTVTRLRPTASGVLVAVTLVGLFSVDLRLYSRVADCRDGFREGIAGRFSELGRLEVPVAPRLDPARFPAHDAPTVQITRTVVAIDAAPATLVSAIETEAAKAAIGNALTKALADAALARSERPSALGDPSDDAVSAPDLAFAIDREVRFSVVDEVLRLACRALACDRNPARLEFRLLRDVPPRIASGAPPEAAYVLPRDYYGIPASFRRQGPFFAAPEDAHFADVVAPLVRAARSTDVRLPIE